MGLFGTGFGLPMAFGGLMQQQQQQQQPAPQQAPQQRQNWGQGLSDIGTALMGAQASIDGNFQGAAGLFSGIGKGREEDLRKRLAEQERQQRVAALTAKGMDPQTAAILAGDDTAVRQTLAPQQAPQQPPAFVRNLAAWNKMTPEEKRQVGEMQNVLQPLFMTGADGQSYQRPPAQTFDPSEWEPYDPSQGGAGPQTPQNFPSGNPLTPPRLR